MYFSQVKLSQQAWLCRAHSKAQRSRRRSFAGHPAQNQVGKALLITGLKNPFPFWAGNLQEALGIAVIRYLGVLWNAGYLPYWFRL